MKMKMKKQFFIWFITAAAFLLMLGSCENLAGLGPQVNTGVPVITTPPDADGVPGAFLSGDAARVEFRVDQPFGMDRVFMEFSYIPREGGSEQQKRVYAEPGPNNVWVFHIDTTGMADGSITAQITAVDVDGNSTTTPPVIYRILNTPPSLVLTLPAGIGEFVDEFSRGLTSTVSFVGSVSVNAVQMFYALGVTEVENPLLGTTHDDHTGWTDTLLHTETPRQGHQRPGQGFDDIPQARLTWSGNMETGFVWRFLNIADIVDAAYYVEPRTPGAVYGDPDYNLWILPIRFKLVDAANNVSFRTVRVLVDPDADLPVTTITSHTQGQMVGGPIRISGTAQDNEVIHTVFRRIFKQTDEQADTTAPPTYMHEDWTPIAFGHGSAFISWATAINQGGELDPPTGRDRRRVLVEFRSSDAFIFSPSAHKSYGNIEQILLDFNNSIPIIGTPVIMQGSPLDIGEGNIETFDGEYFDFAEGSAIAGFVTMRVVVQAPAGLQNIRLRSGSVDIDLLAESNPGFNNINPWLSSPRPFQANGNEYTLFIPMNTTGTAGSTLIGSGFPADTFPFTLEIQLADTTTPSPFIAQSNFMLRVDNRHPFGRYSGALTVINPRYTIAGQAWDHGPGVTVQGVHSVVVYFSRPGPQHGGFGIPITLTGSENTPSDIGWVTNQNVRINRTGEPPLGGNPGTIATEGSDQVLPFFPVLPAADTGIEIRSTEIIGGGAGAFTGGTFGSPPLHNWNIAGFDFSAFNDGPLTVNFVVFDRAGNATFYSQDIYLALNRPVIRGVHLGTNTGAATTQFTSRPMPHGPLDPVDAEFRVRNNNLTLRLNITNPSGDPITTNLTYDVARVTLRSPTPIPASQMEVGGVYRIADRGITTGPNTMDWVSYGVLYDLAALQPGMFAPINPVGITFVARRDGSSSSTGTVFAYDIPADDGLRRRTGTWTGPSHEITFGAASFTGPNATRPIPDSAVVLLPDGVNFTLQNDRFFLIRVTNATGITNTALVRLDIHNTDTRSPAIRIADFGRIAVGNRGGLPIQNFAEREIEYLPLTAAGYNHNIVMTPAGERRGYVQYSWLYTIPATPRADISGRVIFRGMAADNNRITGMTVSIGGAAAIPVATWSGTGLVSAGGSVADMGEPSNTAIWGFNASDQINTLEYSHVLNWEFAWDSARFPGTVGNDVPIVFTVTDASGNTTSETLRVNIVPYITEIVTPLSSVISANPSTFNRSARGWYPVNENSEITLRGFNLSGGAGTSNVFLNNTSLAIIGTPTSTEVRANTGGTAESGSLEVRFGSGAGAIISINNRNDNNAHFNREPNNRNNNLLTDDRYMYVWQTGFLLNAPVVTSPIMTMQPDSTWFLTYGRWGAGPIGVGSVAGTTSQLRVIRSRGYGAAAGAITDTQVETRANRYINMGIATDGIDWFIGATNITASAGGLTNFALNARESAGASPAIHAANRRALLRTVGSNMHRVRTPSLFAQNTTPTNIRGTETHATRVLVGFFDATDNDNALFFNYGLIGGTSLTASTGFGGNFPSGTTTAFNATSHLFIPTIPGPVSNPPLPVNAPQVVASNLTQHNASNYVAVGALANGRPVVAWFDSTHQNLVFSYGDNIPSTTSLAGGETSISNNSTEVWQNNARIIHSGAGTHVRMAIDGNDVIHLAYYDLINGGLFYARIYPTAIGNSPSMDGIHVARVDTHMAAGTRLSIAVRQQTHNGVTSYVPYISYFHSSFGGTRNAIRVAWLRPDSTGNMSVRHGTFGQNSGNLVAGHEPGPGFPVESFTGEWEVMTVPASFNPLSRIEDPIGLVGIGVPSSGNFRAPTNSGGSQSNLARVGSFANNAELNRSVIVGYMTTDNFEGAVLKYSIW